ncbi:MAG: M55 family metallopeptidase, partial [Candidatus Hydrothermia bacterium]
YSAELIPYGQLVQRYESAIERALHSIGKVKPLEITPPFTIELELIDTSSAFLISQIPGTTLLSGRKVSYSSSNFVDIYKFLSVASNMGWINRNLLK